MHPLWNRGDAGKIFQTTWRLEPWLAKEWENVDALTWKITLQDQCDVFKRTERWMQRQ